MAKKSEFDGYVGYDRASRGRSTKQALERNLENMRSDYETFRKPSDPSTRDMTESIGRGKESAARTLKRVMRESDSSRERETRRSYSRR